MMHLHSGNPSFLSALVAGLVTVVVPARAEDPANAPLARYEPHHHVLLQNEFVRIFRVIITPGDATLWHEHNMDFGVLMVNGSRLRGDLPTEPHGPEWMAPTKNFLYFPFGKKPVVHRFNNVDATEINHQLAFELIPPGAVGFAVSDRSTAAEYKMEVDNDRIRMWRLRLAPGQRAGVIIQKAPGIRFILSGDHFVETHDEGAVTEIRTGSGDWAWLPGGASRSVTNVGVTPLELVEIEIK